MNISSLTKQTHWLKQPSVRKFEWGPKGPQHEMTILKKYTCYKIDFILPKPEAVAKLQIH